MSSEQAPRRITRGAQARTRATNTEAGRRLTTASAYQSETVQEEPLEASQFAPGVEPAFVRVAAGKTINLGDFNSLRIDVSVTLPCLPNEIDITHELASEFVAEKMAVEEASWLGTRATASRRGR